MDEDERPPRLLIAEFPNADATARCERHTIDDDGHRNLLAWPGGSMTPSSD
jgi:hypothetical protein